MPLSEFIREARRLTELCNYPNNQDRLIRDMIVSEVSVSEHIRNASMPKSLQECTTFAKQKMPSECKYKSCRLEFVNSIQSAQTMIPVHRPHHGFKQSSNFNRHKNKSSWNCCYCGSQNWTREHSKVCKAKNSICGKCGKKGYLNSLCRSTGTPLQLLEAQHCSHPQSRETAQDYNQSAETVQYSTPYFISREELPQVNCNSLKTVQVSRLGANEQSEHI